MYDDRLQFKPRAPEPGTKAAHTIIEVKPLGRYTPKRLRRPLGRVATHLDPPVRGSQYNLGWRWHLQLWAGVLGIMEGTMVIWVTVTLLGHL